MAANGKAMSGKTCLITGATSGLGEATALALAREGALVVGVGRDPRKCARVQARLREKAANGRVEFLVADLSVQGEIRALVQEILQRYARLDVLVNNAGARFDSRLTSADGLEMTFALNHLGYFLLTNLLLERLKESGGRIVNIASGAHWGCGGIDFDDLQGKKNFDGRRAYAQSKLATLLFTYELDRRLQGSGVCVNAVDPGNVLTRFARNNGVLSWGRHILGSLQSGELLAAEVAVETAVFLASAPELAGVSGRYFHDREAVKSSDASYDAAAARQLWQVSAQLVNLEGSPTGEASGENHEKVDAPCPRGSHDSATQLGEAAR